MNFDFARRYLQSAVIQRDLWRDLRAAAPYVARNCRHQMRTQALRAIDHVRPGQRDPFAASSPRVLADTALGATPAERTELLHRTRALRLVGPSVLRPLSSAFSVGSAGTAA